MLRFENRSNLEELGLISRGRDVFHIKTFVLDNCISEKDAAEPKKYIKLHLWGLIVSWMQLVSG